MNTVFKRFFLLSFVFLFMSCTAPGGTENAVVLIKTPSGEIKIKLYDNSPIHRDNFIKLVKSCFYDGISFHRVIKDFMIQAGDPLTRTGLTKEQLDTLNTYTIPAEFRKEYFHKKGALAAARQGNDVNPEMRSSGTQFYIVQGKKYSDDELINSYLNAGGTPRLDGTYTVFGEVIEGLETVDAIASVQTNQADKPLNDVKKIKMKMVSR